MKERVSEFTQEKLVRLYCASWNVNAKKPSEDIAPWLVVESTQPELFAIGFQEIVDLNAVNLVADHSAAKPWQTLIEQTLKGQYVLVADQHLVGLSLSLYARKDIRQHVQDVASETVGVGIMGVGGNKGGVAIRFRVYDSTLCVVNAHLAAHQHNVQGRNSDFQNIIRRLMFEVGKEQLGVTDHDYVFWIGDLNYRLNLNDLEHVYQRIEAQDWPYLLAHDQLLIEKGAGNAFKGFLEGPIDFAPTYKYQPGTNLYERREDKKKRLPAWCDRIQWISSPDIKQLFYRRAELVASDHKPVMALFEIKAKMVLAEKKEAVYQSLVFQLDAYENECIPKVVMSRNAVHFTVGFDKPVRETLLIENTGQAIVQFLFVPKLQEKSFCKKWMTVSPTYGIVPPRETLEIKLNVHVTRETAHRLNTGEDTLDDILIFRLENGRDYFITISGDYLKSCFGASIDWLVRTPVPVRYTNPQQQVTKVQTLPKELWRIVDYLYPAGLEEEGLFITSGDSKQIDMIRECLDTAQDFGSQFDYYSMGEALVLFLSSLAEPVFPRSLAEQYNESLNLTNWCKQALMQLSAAHYNTFIYLVSFLREVIKRKDKNALTLDQIVFIFTGAIFHADAAELSGKAAARQRAAAAAAAPPRPGAQPKNMVILRHFLTSDEFV
jgi:phosphatidylinositol-bisphosphatase